MATEFPAALDDFQNPASGPEGVGSTMLAVPHAKQHQDANDSIEALERKVGVDGSVDTDSLDYRITVLEQGVGHAHVFNETPSGSIDGVNDSFTLYAVPVAGTLMLFLNGLLQRGGPANDYVQSGATVTFNEAPPAGSVVMAAYII